MIRKQVYLQDSITKEFYVDHTTRIGSLSQALVLSEDNYNTSIQYKVDDYKFYLKALGNDKPRWDVHHRAIARKTLPDFGIVPIFVTVFVDNTIKDYMI